MFENKTEISRRIAQVLGTPIFNFPMSEHPALKLNQEEEYLEQKEYDLVLEKNCEYKHYKDHYSPQPAQKRMFEVKLKFWTNCIYITHAVSYYEKDAIDENHARLLAFDKYPQISDGTLEITEYYGD